MAKGLGLVGLLAAVLLAVVGSVLAEAQSSQKENNGNGSSKNTQSSGKNSNSETDYTPSVSIVSPAVPVLLKSKKLAVSVDYSFKLDGKDRSLDVLLGGSLIDTYSVPKKTTADTKKFNLDLSGLADGPAEVQVIARQGFADSSNIVSSAPAKLAVMVDRTGPSVSQLAPDGEVASGKDVEISAAWSDAQAGVDLDACELTVDGDKVAKKATLTAKGVKYQPAKKFSAGKHQIKVLAVDLAGNKTTATSTFTVALAAPSNTPTVAITVPAAPVITKESAVAVTVSYVFPQASSYNTVVLSVPGQADQTFAVEKKVLSGEASFTAVLGQALADGDLELTAVAYYKSTKNATAVPSLPAVLPVTLDRTAPVVTGQTPAGTGLLRPNEVDIAAELADATAGVNLDSIKLFLDGEDVTAAAQIEADQIKYQPATLLASGVHQVALTVADLAGNVTSVAWDFTVLANEAPVADACVLTPNPQSASPVQLSASPSTDPDDGPYPLTYEWEIVSQPAGSDIALDTSDPMQPVFTPLCAGTYVFRLTVSDGFDSSSCTVEVVIAQAIPLPLAPADGAQIYGLYVDLQWACDPNVEGFYLLVYDSAGKIAAATTLAGSSRRVYLALPGAYTWKVRAYQNGGYGPYSRLCSFSCLFPAPTSTQTQVTNRTVNLAWTAVDQAQKYDYLIYRQGVAGAWRSGSTTGLTAAVALDDGDYYWQVRAYDPVSLQPGPRSEAVNFRVAFAPTPLSTTVNALTVTMNWATVNGAAHYEYRIYRQNSLDAVASGVVADPAVTSASATLTDGDYEWCVRAYDPQTAAYGSKSVLIPFSLAFAPVPVSTVVEGSTMTATWAPVTGASMYTCVVYNAVTGAYVTAKVTADGAATSLTFTDLADGEYYWVVKATSSVTGSYGSYSVTSPFTVLFAPQPVSTEVIGQAMTATWAAVTGASKYTCVVYNAITGAYVTAKVTADAATTSLTFTGLADGEYYWVVKATSVATGSYGPYSVTKPFTVLFTPQPVSTVVSGPTMTATWAAVTGASKYTCVVYNAITGAYVTANVTADAAATSLTFTGLADGEYYWVVKATSAATGGYGPYSATSPFTVLFTPQPVSTVVSGPTMTATWAAVTGASKYTCVVYNAVTGGYVTAKVTADAAATSLTFTGLADGQYYWVVKATSAATGGYGPYSATSPFSVLFTPQPVSTLVSGSTMTATWSAVTGASKYTCVVYNAVTGGYVTANVTADGATTSLSITKLAAGEYYWVVKATSSVTGSYGSYSPTSAFTVSAP